MRPDWDRYFMNIAEQVAKRASCPRLSVGTVLVKNKRIISTGYNGAPPGVKDCLEQGCLVANGSCARVIHSELNALLYAREDCKGARAYTTHAPCMNCMNALIAAGVNSVVYLNDYKTPAYGLLKILINIRGPYVPSNP